MAAMPLAPADGKIAALGVAKLTPQTNIPAVLFEPDPAAPAPELTAMPSDAAAIPEMLRSASHRWDDAEAVRRLLSAGVWADRWTSPDLLAQLRSAGPIDAVLCNALDESPEMLMHHELVITRAEEMTAGVLALAAITGAEECWAVVAAFGDPAGWDAIRSAARNTSLKLGPLQDHYPQAPPTLLIHEITGRHSRPGKLPTDNRVLVLDAPAAVAVGRCFLDNTPMLTVPVGVRCPAGRSAPHWIRCRPIGMPWSHLLTQLSMNESWLELRGGNPLRELRLSGECIIAGGELGLTTSAPERLRNPDPCIRCAWCVEGCPVSIQPAGLLEAAQQNDPHLGMQYGLEACVECGICTYVCPSHLPILAGIRTLRVNSESPNPRRAE